MLRVQPRRRLVLRVVRGGLRGDLSRDKDRYDERRSPLIVSRYSSSFRERRGQRLPVFRPTRATPGMPVGPTTPGSELTSIATRLDAASSRPSSARGSRPSGTARRVAPPRGRGRTG